MLVATHASVRMVCAKIIWHKYSWIIRIIWLLFRCKDITAESNIVEPCWQSWNKTKFGRCVVSSVYIITKKKWPKFWRVWLRAFLIFVTCSSMSACPSPSTYSIVKRSSCQGGIKWWNRQCSNWPFENKLKSKFKRNVQKSKTLTKSVTCRAVGAWTEM